MHTTFYHNLKKNMLNKIFNYCRIHGAKKTLIRGLRKTLQSRHQDSNIFSIHEESLNKIYGEAVDIVQDSNIFSIHEESLNKIYGEAVDIVTGRISEELLKSLQGFKSLKLDNNVYGCLNEIHTNLIVDHHSSDILSRLNTNLIVHPIHNIDPKNKTLLLLHDEIRKMFSAYVKSPFVIVNTRMWSTRPSSELFGPNTFHTDGMRSGHLKIMIYLTPLNKDYGFLKVKEGEINNMPAGTAVLFKNSDILHAGVPGLFEDRISIEVTLMRAFLNRPQISCGHFFGRHYRSPLIAYEDYTYTGNLADSILSSPSELISQAESASSKFNECLKKINIGSGRRKWDGWINYDEIIHDGVTNITLNSKLMFPLDDNSVSLVYSSHCFEHLPDETINKILKEILRVMTIDGTFILKIPDFDWFLEQYASQITHSVSAVGFESVIHTWASKGVTDTFENRISMMFCGYWNIQYGDHFSGSISNSKEQYHGPAVMRDSELKSILTTKSPKEISRALVDIVKLDPDFKAFNHQNAWSTDEMSLLLEENGFSIESIDRNEIMNRFDYFIPDLNDMKSWSSYYLIKKS